MQIESRCFEDQNHEDVGQELEATLFHASAAGKGSRSQLFTVFRGTWFRSILGLMLVAFALVGLPQVGAAETPAESAGKAQSSSQVVTAGTLLLVQRHWQQMRR